MATGAFGRTGGADDAAADRRTAVVARLSGAHWLLQLVLLTWTRDAECARTVSGAIADARARTFTWGRPSLPARFTVDDYAYAVLRRSLAGEIRPASGDHARTLATAQQDTLRAILSRGSRTWSRRAWSPSIPTAAPIDSRPLRADWKRCGCDCIFTAVRSGPRFACSSTSYSTKGGWTTSSERSTARERARLTGQFGRGRWKKLKGRATVRLQSGDTCRVELHWYEAHGIGRRKFKIKRFLA